MEVKVVHNGNLDLTVSVATNGSATLLPLLGGLCGGLELKINPGDGGDGSWITPNQTIIDKIGDSCMFFYPSIFFTLLFMIVILGQVTNETSGFDYNATNSTHGNQNPPGYIPIYNHTITDPDLLEDAEELCSILINGFIFFNFHFFHFCLMH